jgi:hypothetical protein
VNTSSTSQMQRLTKPLAWKTLEPPLTADQHAAVTDSKQMIYEGFGQALGSGVPMAQLPFATLPSTRHEP